MYFLRKNRIKIVDKYYIKIDFRNYISISKYNIIY